MIFSFSRKIYSLIGVVVVLPFDETSVDDVANSSGLLLIQIN